MFFFLHSIESDFEVSDAPFLSFCLSSFVSPKMSRALKKIVCMQQTLCLRELLEMRRRHRKSKNLMNIKNVHRCHACHSIQWKSLRIRVLMNFSHSRSFFFILFSFPSPLYLLSISICVFSLTSILIWFSRIKCEWLIINNWKHCATGGKRNDELEFSHLLNSAFRRQLHQIPSQNYTKTIFTRKCKWNAALCNFMVSVVNFYENQIV